MSEPKEYDEITVSGYCLSSGKFVYNMRAVVGCAAKHNPQFKVWPSDPRSDGDDKMWFDRRFAHWSIVA
jgi:hypothetical protein